MEYWGNHAQGNACQSYWQGNPNSNFYNENPRNEPDFSWTSNNVQNPPFHPIYPNPPYHYQPTYQQPYHPPFQPTYREPYHYPDFQMSTFQQPPPYNPPQPNNDLAELKGLMQQLLSSQIEFQKVMDTTLTQPAPSENREEYSYTRPSSILLDRVINPALEDTTVPDRVEYYPVECPMFQSEFAKLDRATCRASYTRSSILPIDRVKAPAPNDNFTRSSKPTTGRVTAPELPITEKEPEAKIVIRLPFPNRQRQARVEHQFDTTNTPSAVIDPLEATPIGEELTQKQNENVIEALGCPDSQEEEVDDHRAVIDALEVALYGTEPIRGQGEMVSEVVHTSEAIEVMTSELQSEVIEVNNLELELSPSDFHINMLHDNEDCFIIGNITLSEHHPLEKGHFFCIQGQEGLKPTIPEVAKEEVRPEVAKEEVRPEVAKEELHPEKNGTRRGIKRCWDPGGSFDKVRLVPWARKRDSGNRFGGANGRGTQDDYDDPGGEHVTTQSVQ